MAYFFTIKIFNFCRNVLILKECEVQQCYRCFKVKLSYMLYTYNIYI